MHCKVIPFVGTCTCQIIYKGDYRTEKYNVYSIHELSGNFADLAGFGFCILSLLCAVVLGLFDRRAERILKRKENGTGEQISLKDIKDFPLRLWLVFIICVAYYVTVFPFIGLAT